MATPLKPERRTARIGGAIRPSIKKKFAQYAKKNGVTESRALEYIVELFLETNFRSTEAENQPSKSQATESLEIH